MVVYIINNSIKRYIGNSSIFEKGRNIYLNNLAEIEVETYSSYKKNNTLYINVTGIVMGINLSVLLKYDSILSAFVIESSNCTSCSKDICEHVAAFILFINEKDFDLHKYMNTKDETDVTFENIIATYVSNLDTVSCVFVKDIIPELVYKNGTMAVGFKVKLTNDKIFVMKNILKFYYDMVNNNKIVFGKDTKVYCSSKYIENRTLLNWFIEFTQPIFNTLKDSSTTVFSELINLSNSSYRYLSYSDNAVASMLEITKENIAINFNDIFISDSVVVVKNTHKPVMFSVKKDKFYQIELKHFVDDINMELFGNYAYFFNSELDELSFYKFKSNTNVKFAKLVNDQNFKIKEKHVIGFSDVILPELQKDFYFENGFETEITYGGEVITQITLIKNVLNVEVEFKNKEEISIRQMVQYQNIFGKYTNTNVIEIRGVKNIIEFIETDLIELRECSDVVRANEEFLNFKIIEDFNLNINVNMVGLEFDLEFESSDFDREELIYILNRISQGEKSANINGKFVNLGSDDIVKIHDTIKLLDLGEIKELSTKLPYYKSFYVNSILSSAELNIFKSEQFNKMISRIENKQLEQVELSTNVRANLRDYQLEGVNWLSMLRDLHLNGILADDMGLGKTLQIIAFLSSIKYDKPVLIVVPASLIYNWDQEINKFNDQLKYKVITGDKPTRTNEINNIKNEIVITTYDLVKSDIDLYQDILFEYVILDEGQKIKNTNTLTTRAVKVLRSEHRLVLSGTPVENNLLELWSIFDFLMPGYLGSKAKFSRTYNSLNSFEENKDVLKTLVSPFVLRRLKTDVLDDLPEKIEKEYHVKMSVDQQKFYDAHLLEYKEKVLSTDNKIIILSLLTKLRQICCNPALLDDTYDGSSTKEAATVDLILDLKEGQHKTLLFSQFTSNFDLLVKLFNKNSISYKIITGSTSKYKRNEIVNMFNEDDTDVLLISLKAGGTGLNITGADTVIHYDPWWNVAVQNQATDRAHRIGQKNKVVVYKMICENTIEEKIVQMHESKQEIADSIITNDENSLATISSGDLLELFE